MNQQELISQFNNVVSLINQALDSSESYKKASEEFFSFLDQNYDFYLISSPEERDAIRRIVKTNNEHNLIDFFLLGYAQRAIKQIESFGEKEWLKRALVVLVMEDGVCDHRDTIELLAHLFVVAEEKDLSPDVEFQEIAKIANNEPSLSGAKPMSQILLEIPSIAHEINDERKKYS